MSSISGLNFETPKPLILRAPPVVSKPTLSETTCSAARPRNGRASWRGAIIPGWIRRVRYAVAISRDGHIAGPNGEARLDHYRPGGIDFAAIFNAFDTIFVWAWDI